MAARPLRCDGVIVPVRGARRNAHGCAEGVHTCAGLDCRMSSDSELNWDDLRYFLRAVQAGTLAGAARAMAVDHSTIGRRLSALERALGAPLVIRAPDGLHLTP